MKTLKPLLYAFLLSVPALTFAQAGHDGHTMPANGSVMQESPDHAAAGMAGDASKVIAS
ncbi:MAG: hypothetical protein M3Y32_11895 [Pseudomonadota bacterium]|nr:hypothetical protein [Pseudomonadota bacterium]